MKEQLEDLKGKLPFLNKGASKKEAAEEEVNEDDEVTSVVKESKAAEQDVASDVPAWKQKLAEQLPFLAKALGVAPAAQSNSDDKTDANVKVPTKDAATEKRQKLVRVVLVVFVLYLAYDTLLSEQTPETESADVANLPDKPKRKKEKKAAATDAQPSEATPPSDTPVADSAPADSAPADSAPVAQAPADTTTPATSDAPVNGDGALDLGSVDVPSTDSTPIEGKAGEGVDLSDPVSAQDAKTNQIDLGIPAEGSTTVTDAPTAAPADSTPSTEPAMGDMESPDVPTGDTNTAATPADGGGDMTEMILKDLEKQMDGSTGVATTTESISTDYVSPPNYENIGRGIVYNCLGKHWACIDGPSFKICQQNQAARGFQGKKKECVADSVYQTDSACAWIQKQKITKNTGTEFCN